VTHHHSHHAPPDVSKLEKEQFGHAQIPLVAFAGELVRLAEVVKQNLISGVPPVQTLSQLNAMEPIIGILRVTGLKSMKEVESTRKQSDFAGYL
jgi:hypothetical protein